MISGLLLFEVVNIIAIQKSLFDYEYWRIPQLIFSGMLVSIFVIILVFLLAFAIRRVFSLAAVIRHRFMVSLLLISLVYVGLFVANIGEATFTFRQCSYFHEGSLSICGAIFTTVDAAILLAASIFFGHLADKTEAS